jgi:hypothetical protein
MGNRDHDVMKKFFSFAAYLAVVLLSVSCGSDHTLVNSNPGGTAQVATIQVLASSPQLPSDTAGANFVDITATVKDATNQLIKGAVVGFGSTSGSLAVSQATTDDTGVAKARITDAGDPTNRSITITATSSGVSGSIVVSVTGTTLKVTGPNALAQGDTGNYTILLQDSKGVGIPQKVVSVSSATGNTLSSNSLVTGVTGDAAFTVTASASGADTVTVSALGLSIPVPIAVSSDSFAFSVPAINAQVDLGAVQTMTVRWTKAGTPQVGQTISFSSTRGTLSAASAVTDANGDASVTISAANAGPASLAAVNPEATSTKRDIEFIATTAQTLDLQADPFTVGTGDQSTLTAIVRDPTGNLVKNKTVVFSLSDVTGGSLTVGSAVTDSQGKAQTFYKGGSVPSQANAVSVTATVQGTAVQDTVNLTVARKELFISLGTGNTIFSIGTATFAKEWSILVTDVDGNAVANKQVQTLIRSVKYRKGRLAVITPPGGTAGIWTYDPSAGPNECPDEDANNNGILDPGEDGGAGPGANAYGNQNGLIEAGNIALVAAVPESAPLDNPCATAGAAGVAANVTTNAQGRARVCVFYPKNYNLWLDARITAKASVSGTEFARSQYFTLDALASDITNTSASPPGVVSPFDFVSPTVSDLAACPVPPR